MRLVVLLAATALFGLAAGADGVSRKAVSSPDIDRLTATDASAWSGPDKPGHEKHRYRHGSTYKVNAGSTADACQAVCGEDGICQSWSFVEAYGSAPARCELKQGAGKSEENLLATSGVSPRVDASYWGNAVVAMPAPSETLSGEIDPTPEIEGN